jgi:hypothetical protein
MRNLWEQREMLRLGVKAFLGHIFAELAFTAIAAACVDAFWADSRSLAIWFMFLWLGSQVLLGFLFSANRHLSKAEALLDSVNRESTEAPQQLAKAADNQGGPRDVLTNVAKGRAES